MACATVLRFDHIHRYAELAFCPAGKRLDQTIGVRPIQGSAGGPEVHGGLDSDPSLIISKY